MESMIIDDKKYYLIPEEVYYQLQKAAVLKHSHEKTFTIDEARTFSKTLIRKLSIIK